MLARRSVVPVDLDVRVDGRLPGPIEVDDGDGVLRVCVRDDGRGGARFTPESGLLGLRDRVEALGGRLTLQTAPGAGSAVKIALPSATPAARVRREGRHDPFRMAGRRGP